MSLIPAQIAGQLLFHPKQLTALKKHTSDLDNVCSGGIVLAHVYPILAPHIIDNTMFSARNISYAQQEIFKQIGLDVSSNESPDLAEESIRYLEKYQNN